MDMRSWSCRSGKDVIRLGRPAVYQDDGDIISSCCGKLSRWRVAWNRLRTRLLGRRSAQRRSRGYYDAYTYAQNFDEGRAWDQEEEAENLSRSFSVRYADPSRFMIHHHIHRI